MNNYNTKNMKRNMILTFCLMLMALSVSAQKVSFPQKGKLFHYAPYPRGVSFENPGELLDEVKLLPMQCYDFECDSVWKAPRQKKISSDERGIWLDKLYMVDADVSFAKAGSQQSLYVAFTIDKGDDYPGPVAFVRRGEQPSQWYYPFRYNKNQEIRFEGRANSGDSAVCAAQWRIPELYQELCRVLVEMEKDGKTTVYLADTALVFYNAARTEAAEEPDRLVLCPFSDGRIYELVYYNRFLSDKEKYEVLRHGTPDGDCDNKYTIPIPQMIQNNVEADEAPMGIHWSRGFWIGIMLSILLALISLYVRFSPMKGVPYTFNGSWIIIGLAVAGALFYIYLVPSAQDNKYLYYISIIVGYWLVCYVPDPTGYRQASKKTYDLSKLPGCVWLVIIVVVGSLAYMFGPAVSALLPMITLFMFCKNMWLTFETRQYLKNNVYEEPENMADDSLDADRS